MSAPERLEPAEKPIGTSCLLTVAGERFHCPDCRSNVFTLVERRHDPDSGRHDPVYRCNGCGNRWLGERS